MTERWLKWAHWDQVEDYLRLGWMLPPESTHSSHSLAYGLYMEWKCCCGRAPKGLKQ